METPYYQSVDRLLHILNELREKCPWDRKQTVDSLRVQSIEELYELTDAISEKNWDNMKEELGDLLLHLVFYSKIAEEEGHFAFKEVVEGVCNKLVARHPHIYEHVVAKDDQQVKRNWEKLKLKEGKESVLSGIPKSMPALVKALALQRKAAQVGFDWKTTPEVVEKVKEEWNELQAAIEAKDTANMEEEFGDLMFSLLNYARFLKVDAEGALEETNKKFIRRFQEIEQAAKVQKRELKDMSLGEMDELWNQAKKKFKNS